MLSRRALLRGVSIAAVAPDAPLGCFAAAGAPAGRPITVRDCIAITSVVPAGSEGVSWSADGRHALFITCRGDEPSNGNIYALHLFVARAETIDPPTQLVQFATGGNAPAIDLPRWIDTRTIAFVGRTSDDFANVYLLDIISGDLEQLTDHDMPIIDYSIGTRGGPVLFEAQARVDLNARMGGGYVVGASLLHSVLHPHNRRNPYKEREFFVKHGDSIRRVPLDRYDTLAVGPGLGMWTAPDGSHAVMLAKRKDYDRSWWDRYLAARRNALAAHYRSGEQRAWSTELTSLMPQYHLLDLTSLKLRPIIDAPAAIGLVDGAIAGALWRADSRVVYLEDSFLPLQGTDTDELRRRASHPSTVRFTLATGRLEKLDAGMPVAAASRRTSIELAQGLDRPPDFFLVRGGRRLRRLTRLNPQLDAIDLGELKPVEWTDESGRQQSGNLMLPRGYRAGRPCAFVLYTHGYGRRHRNFWIGGPYGSTGGYAGRALAAQGVAVLEIMDRDGPRATPQEISMNVDRYVGAIRWMIDCGVADASRIGVHAWSRTGYYLIPLLADGRVRIAAASVCDADILSRQHYTDFYGIPEGMAGIEGLMGGALWSEGGPALWAQRDQINRLAHVTCPLRIEMTGWLPAWWDAYALLRRNGRPVECLSYPDGAHSFVKPRERLSSQQGSVDWYRFWLLGEENSDPACEDQYGRWRALRA